MASMGPLILAASLIAIAHAPQTTPSYSVIRTIPIGGEGGWDDLTIDSRRHRLYITRGTHVMVLNVDSGKIVGDIPNTQGVHGVAIAGRAGKGYASDGRDDSVTVFELGSLKALKTVKVGSRPDAIRYDPASRRVFTFNAGSQDSTVVDTGTDTVAGTIKLDGKPEFSQADGRGNLYVNIEDKSEIQRIDTKAMKVTATWPLAPGEEPSGLALDNKNHILFSTCSNNVMAVSDAQASKVIAAPKIGSGPDGAGFDPAYDLAFSSNGQDGTLTVIGRLPTGTYDAVQTVKTKPSARTMTIDPRTHRIYLIAADLEPQTDPSQRRRRMVPGSTQILVVAPK
jgi:DNA-binding beta-propeller fold protein YncE